MTNLQKLKQFVITRFSRKNTAIAAAGLVMVTAFGLFLPNQERVTNAQDNIACANGPTDNRPHLNTFPVRSVNNNAPVLNPDGTYTCYDFPFMAARKGNGSFTTGSVNNVANGDMIQVRLYVHNTAPANGPASTVANDVSITSNFTNNVNKAVITASASATNAPEHPSGRFEVNLASGQRLELVENSGQIQHYGGGYGRSDFQIGNNTVTLFPTLEGCYDKSKFVYYKFRVVQDTPQQGNLQITKEVRNVTRSTSYAPQTTARTNDTVQYRISVSATTASVPNVVVTDTLPQGIVANNDLTLNGTPVNNGNIHSSGGYTLPSVSTTFPQTFIFTARVTSTQCNASLINTARAVSGSISVSDTATVTTQCDQPVTVVCAPNSQTVNINQFATLSASGGNGSYSWSAPSGNPTTGNQSTFSVRYPSAGTYNVTVTSAGQSDSCTVVVRDIIITPDLVCFPASQTADINQLVSFSVSGATSTVTWSAPSGSPATGSGTSFSTRYATSGNKVVTATSGNRTANCSVFIREVTNPNVVCAPKTQTVNINQYAYFNATGGNGTYSWTASGGNPTSGSTQSFSTRYASSGTYTVTVSSDGRIDSCTVYVQPDINLDVFCVPDNQEADINENVTVSATGGNGFYSWFTSGGNPSSGTGRDFTTRYNSEGTKTITVTSGNRSDTCTVRVDEDNDNNRDARITIVKSVRNLTTSTGFENSVNASRNDRVQFEVIVRSTGSRTAHDVVLTDTFPDELTLDRDSIRVDGSSRSTSASNFRLSLGDIDRNDQVRITFNATVNTNSSENIRNLARATASNASSVQDDAHVFVGVSHGNPSIQLSKIVRNDRTGEQGTNVKAAREDYLTYTLTVRNNGNSTADNFVISDDLSGILSFADVVDMGGGHMNGQTLTYSAMDIRAGQTVTKTFRVRVKYHLAAEQSYVLQNTYGNLVTVNVPGTSTFVAPKTGSSGTSAAVFAGLLTSGFVLYRKRQQLFSFILA
ncbi:MAG: DUF11 domain-containing protein [Candidatus Doudnabacteria bacterium]|nr:DUF11 domain-containing protein [Candidatus Doudnabacteria bacterium]